MEAIEAEIVNELDFIDGFEHLFPEGEDNEDNLLISERRLQWVD